MPGIYEAAPGDPDYGVIRHLYVAATEDGGVQLGVGEPRDVLEEFTGIQDQEWKVPAVELAPEERWRLGRALLAGAPPEQWDPAPVVGDYQLPSVQ